ncbi:MAG: PepSY domain-containing protein [Azoarcus sp.]|nr:PepSY domain-containing protein [Azoarcus sp.]
MPNRHHTLRNGLASAGLALMLLHGSAATAAASAQEAREILQAKAYTAIHDLKLRHGFWTAEVTAHGGARVDVLIDGDNRIVEAGGQGTASARNVIARLQSLGYRQIRDVELDDAFWEAEARNAAGIEVEVVLHPVTLEVLSEIEDDAGRVSPRR